MNDSNIESKLKKSTAVFIDLIDEHMCKESGYTLKSFIGIEMNVDEYEPLRGSSYIDLPKFLKDKKCIINIQNNNHKCFIFALESALRPVKTHANRP